MLQINPGFPYSKPKRFMNSWNDVFQPFFAILELALGKHGIMSCQECFPATPFQEQVGRKKRVQSLFHFSVVPPRKAPYQLFVDFSCKPDFWELECKWLGHRSTPFQEKRELAQCSPFIDVIEQLLLFNPRQLLVETPC